MTHCITAIFSFNHAVLPLVTVVIVAFSLNVYVYYNQKEFLEYHSL